MAVVPVVESYQRLTVSDASGVISNFESGPIRYGLGVPGLAAPIDTELVCPAGVFTAATVPAGSRSVKIRVGTAPSLVLKAQTGDVTGIAITPATNPIGDDMYLTLASGAVFGFLNSGSASATIRLIFC